MSSRISADVASAAPRQEILPSVQKMEEYFLPGLSYEIQIATLPNHDDLKGFLEEVLSKKQALNKRLEELSRLEQQARTEQEIAWKQMTTRQKTTRVLSYVAAPITLPIKMGMVFAQAFDWKGAEAIKFNLAFLEDLEQKIRSQIISRATSKGLSYFGQ